MSAAALDSNVLVYALLEEAPQQPACTRIIEHIADGRLDASVDAAVLQETLHVLTRLHGDREWAATRVGEISRFCRVAQLGAGDGRLALELYRRHEALDAMDALIAARVIRAGDRPLVSADRAFDTVAGLTRIDPLDTLAIEALAN